jgi:hypothetical protein
MSAEPGQIYTYVMRSERGKREWFVGEYSETYRDVVGVCFASEYQRVRVGQCFSMSSCMKVPDHEVPDEIWAALAKWRLTSA